MDTRLGLALQGAMVLGLVALLCPFAGIALGTAESGRAESGLDPLVLTIQEGMASAPVSYGSNATIQLHAKVSAIGGVERETRIDFASHPSWPIATLPAIVYMEPGESQKDLLIYLTVPYNTTAGQVRVEVYGVWSDSTGEGEVKGDFVYVSVAQYTHIGADFGANVTKINPETESTEIKMNLFNLGNSPERFDVIYADPYPEVISPSFTPKTTPQVPAFGAIDITIAINLREWVEGTYAMDFQVKARSNATVMLSVSMRAYLYRSEGFIALGYGTVLYLSKPEGRMAVGPGEEGVEASIKVWSFLAPAHEVRLYTSFMGHVTATYLGNVSEGEGRTFDIVVNLTAMGVRFVDNYTSIRMWVIGKNTTWSNPRTVVITRSVEKGGMAAPTSLMPTLAVAAVVGGTAFTGFGAGMWLYSERFRLAALLLLIPLYTRLKEDKVLNHFIRGRIYEYVRENPGAHFSEIRRVLELGNGECAYHLYRLEKAELVKSRFDGRLKRYYITGVKITPEIYGAAEAIKRKILHEIATHPGITEHELAQRIKDRKERTIKHYVKKMERNNEIILVKDGKHRRCYLPEAEVVGGVISEKGDSNLEGEGRAHQDLI